MRFSGVGTLKKLSEVVAGELVWVRGGPRFCLGIALEPSEGRVTVGLLDAGEYSWRLESYSFNNAYCYSLGTGWVLDCDDAKDPLIKHSNDAAEQSKLMIGEGGPVFVFADRHYSMFYHLLSSELTIEGFDRAVPISQFRIWANENSFNRSGANPVFNWPTQSS